MNKKEKNKLNMRKHREYKRKNNLCQDCNDKIDCHSRSYCSICLEFRRLHAFMRLRERKPEPPKLPKHLRIIAEQATQNLIDTYMKKSMPVTFKKVKSSVN